MAREFQETWRPRRDTCEYNSNVLNLPYALTNRTNCGTTRRRLNFKIMESAESALKTKLKQLERAEEKADQVLKAEKQSAMQRQLTNLKELITEVDSARRKVEALKIEAKVNDRDINEWNNAITAKIEEADSHIENLEQWLENKNEKKKCSSKSNFTRRS